MAVHTVEDGECVQSGLPPGQCATCRGLDDWTTLEALQPGSFTAEYNSLCAGCNDWILKGTPARYNAADKVVHQSC